jgi:hypothetical protein
MVAWEAHKLTNEYANTRKWALAAKAGEQSESYVDGSLWACFAEGFNAATALSAPNAAEPAVCSHPSWKESNGEATCDLCGVKGYELRYLKPHHAQIGGRE